MAPVVRRQKTVTTEVAHPMFEGMNRDTGTAERRRSDRTGVRLPVIIRVPGMSPATGSSVNVSTNGLLVEVATDIPLGIELRIVMELPGEVAPLELKALGVRIRPAPSGLAPFEIALAFIHPADAVMRRLSEFVFAI
jgi:hypothetical protein